MNPIANDLFSEAHEMDEDERAVFLAETCGDDAELRLEVQRLLVDAQRAESFFANSEGTTIGAEEFEETYTEGEGDQVGPYTLRQRIGEGGFGTVWMAEQSEPISRMVALKVVKAGMDTRQVLARFEAERQALAIMDHPNIARVLDAGATASGRPYFAMELVKGVPITKFCDEQKLDTRARLELFRDVCAAINHAHQKGVIHRDIKSSNVMVTLIADLPIPKVIDFGIAKATQSKLTDQTLFTRFEQFLGTPVYMSPEQAAMSGQDIDTRADIYSLGVLLYELLAGKPPFDPKTLVSAGYDEMRRIIKEDEPPKPSTQLTQSQTAGRHPDVTPHALRGDLDWIVMKAIEKNRTRRYETANAFSADIGRYLADEPVTAAAPSAGYKMRKFIRRNRASFTAGATIALLLLVGGTVSTWQAVRATHSANAAAQATVEKEEQRRLAEETAESLRLTAYVADMGSARQAISEFNFGRAREILNRHRLRGGQSEIRGFEWRLLWGLSQSQETAILGNYRGVDNWGGLAVSPDGQVVASIEASSIVIRSLPEGELIRRLQPVQGPLVRFSPDGAHLIVQDGGEVLRRWSTANWVEQPRLEEAGEPFAFSPNGKLLVAGSGQGLAVWSTETWTRIKPLPGTINRNRFLRQALAVSPDDGTVFYGGDDGVIRTWNLAEGRESEPLDTMTDNSILCLAISPQGLLAAAHWSGRVTLWDLESRQRLAERADHLAWVSTVAFSADGSVLASASADRTVALYDIDERDRTVTLRKRLVGHEGEVWAMAFGADQRTLLTGCARDGALGPSGREGTLRLWNGGSDKSEGAIRISIPLEFALNETSRDLVGWSETDGFVKRELSGPDRKGSITPLADFPVPRGAEVGVRTWRSDSFNPLRNRVAGRKWVAQLFYPEGPSSKDLPSLGIVIFNLQTGKEEKRIHDPGIVLRDLTFSADGSSFATASAGMGLRIWDTSDWSSSRQLLPDYKGGAVLCFSPDGGKLAVLKSREFGKIGESVLLDPSTGEVEMQLRWDGSSPMANAFSNDGTLLAVGTGDNRIHLFDLKRKRKCPEVLDGHVAGVRGLCFSPDGRTLVSCGDMRVKLWNVELGQELFTLHRAKTETAWPIFAADGSCLVTASDQPGVLLWRAPSWEEIAAAEAEQQ